MSSLVESGLLNSQKIPGLSGWIAQWNQSEGFHIFSGQENNLPATSADSHCFIIFEGFLQNRSELMSELGSSDSSANDVDVILLAFSRWREDLVYKLRGVFLLAIWDKIENALLFVRDHCGIYPAFYAKTGSQIVFSTSVADIIRHPNVTPALNRSAFVDYLCHRRPVPEETFYAEIKRVLPGHLIRFTNSGDQVRRYWYSTPPEGIQDYITDENVTGFDQALEQAVRRCMQLGRTGIFLSGGLDSVSIASIATELSKQGGVPMPIALSLGFPHPDCDEVDKQTSVAEQLGLQIHLKKIEDILKDEGLLHLGLELGKKWSQPMWDTWQALYIALGSEGRENGCDVILTGSGGDEWLNVGDNLIADLLRLWDFRGLSRTIKIFQRSYPPDIPKGFLLRHLLWNAGLRLVLADYARSLAKQIAPGVLRKTIRKRMRRSTLSWVAPDPKLKAEADDRIELLVDQYMHKMLPKDKYPFYSSFAGNHFVDTNTSMMMEQHFEGSKHMGVHLLYPYFDPDVINLLVRISPEVLQQGGMEKGIVRKAVAKRFPNLKFQKQKKVSAGNYFQSTITTEGRDLYKGTGGPTALIELGIIDGKQIDGVMQQGFVSKNRFENGKIWDVLLLETWLRSHR